MSSRKCVDPCSFSSRNKCLLIMVRLIGNLFGGGAGYFTKLSVAQSI